MHFLMMRFCSHDFLVLLLYDNSSHYVCTHTRRHSFTCRHARHTDTQIHLHKTRVYCLCKENE